ncbi:MULTISPECIES: SDR family NAD(P)-dependent oxidoreductase [Aliivibrio]|uniref:Short-chain dehydrogenase n=2 Tax=Aliivibrio logei TaxID=688 RepID=A0A1B9P3L8_ALILO|nr:SDR family oxidoreductase [Aliivibrio logei]MBB1313587.1 SDR family oxidoreductase [Aliivibrio sp. SR45-2]OCH23107.1 short-chain dehydrogenase [Aliivibrio logei]OEF22468.1 short-chain dehydrogenase [Aliivibrio logei 5S-186]
MNNKPWICITGSASGLGRYLTGKLLNQGHQIIATDINKEALQTASKEDNWISHNLILETLDITVLAEWEQLLERHAPNENRQGNKVFSHLLNIAGFIQPGDAFENTVTQFKRHLDINVMGMINGCSVFLPHFTKHQQGHIINIASFAGILPVPGVVAYSTSKAAARSFSNGLAMDLYFTNSPINVSCVCPDLIATPMMDKQVGYGKHSRFVFSGDKPLTVEEVGDTILTTVWQKKPIEVALPRKREIQVRLLSLFPNLMLPVYKYLAKKGEKKLARLQ